jgi:TRAP-type mannitol/chloroaromatic compound transport system substrate-binding protein
MGAAYKQAQTLYAELAAGNPRFKTVYEAWSQFRDKETTWFRIAELPFDVFVTQQSQQSRL